MLSYDSASIPIKGQAPASVPLPPSLQATPTTPSPLTTAANDQQIQDHHIWLVTGPAGCGKSTIAEYLANTLNMPYIEGDAFHPPTNVEKMRTGTPLTDADRWDWLTALREESIRQINRGANGVVLTCSALKRKYRDVIRVAGYFDHRLLIHFIFLDAPEEVLMARVSQRQGHYMGASMVHSQFEVLERPTGDEKDVITLDVSRTVDDVKRDALASVLETMTEAEDEEP